MFEPNLDRLPPPQRRLWDELRDTPQEFVLYGGTAIALRLGHRPSMDFDFFANRPFQPADLQRQIPYLQGATVQQSAANTLTCLIDRDGPVQVSFFGGLPLNRINDPERAGGPAIQIASLLDLAATKAKVVLERASWKDYVDVDALIRHGIALAEALSAARAVYGPDYNPLLTLKALSYFDDGDLQTLGQDLRQRLRQAVAAVDLAALPPLKPRRGLVCEGSAP